MWNCCQRFLDDYLQLHEELERSLASGRTEPRQKVVPVDLCDGDNGKSKFLFLFHQRERSQTMNCVFICDFMTSTNVSVHQVTLPAIQVSVSELLFFNSLKKSTQTDNSQSRESRACLAYLLFVQLITLDSFPAVFRWDETWCDDAHSPHAEETVCSLTVQQQTINIVLFPPVPALYLFFSATWSTSINYSIGSLFIQYQLFLFGKDWIYDWIYNLVCLAAKMNRTCSKDW